MGLLSFVAQVTSKTKTSKKLLNNVVEAEAEKLAPEKVSKGKNGTMKKKRCVKIMPKATAVIVAPTSYRLQDELDAFLAEFVVAQPKDLVDIFAHKSQKLARSGIIERAVKEGDLAPNFALPDAVTGKTIRLFDLLHDGPVILSFYRGEWCAYCNLELKALQKNLPKFQALGAKLVAISPQIPEYTESTIQKNGLSAFSVLSDSGAKVAQKYGIDFLLDEDLRPLHSDLGIDIPLYNGDNTFRLPVPATYVIDTDGTVLYSFVNTDFTKRAEPEDVLKAIPYYGES